MLKEALSVRCTVCGWSRAGLLEHIEPFAIAHARTGHEVLLRLPPVATRRNLVGTSGADIGRYTPSGFVAARPSSESARVKDITAAGRVAGSRREHAVLRG